MSEPEKQIQHPPQDTDPSPVPGEKTRRLNIALSAEVEDLLRRVSARTSIPIAELRRAVEESPQVQAAARQAIRFRYDGWVKALEGGEDLFGEKAGKEG